MINTSEKNSFNYVC